MSLVLQHGSVLSGQRWSNFSGTYSDRHVPLWCTMAKGDDVTVMQKHAEDLRRVLDHCFSQPTPATLRVLGSGWSFSSVLEPGDVGLDAGGMTFMHKPTPDQLSAAYAPRTAQGYVPVYFQGGRAISFINQRLGRDGLALQTSGAGDGHRIAGCIATGTHGAALKIGALHDTVLALHLMVAPDRAVLVQPGTDSPFTPELAAWLQARTGLPTDDLADDEAFHAAQVSLGSLGVVLGVVVEAAPIYQMRIHRFRERIDSNRMWSAIDTLDLSALHPHTALRPDHFDVLINPYPDRLRSMMFGTLMWKEPAPGVPVRDPAPGIARASSDTLGLITRVTAGLGGMLTASLGRQVLQTQVNNQLVADHTPATDLRFPGEIFGPTTLPRGSGASTELAVDQKDAVKALRTILHVLDRQASRGRFFLGVIAARFVPQTKALIGMNQAPMTCFIELPSGRNDDVVRIYKAIWTLLDQSGIPFTCHWGQMGGFKTSRVQAYYGAKAARWSAARRRILRDDPVAMQVFAARILDRAGL